MRAWLPKHIVFLLLLLPATSHSQTIQSTDRLSTAPDGTGGLGTSIAPATSPNGSMAVFRSSAPNLIDGGTNGLVQVFLRELIANTTSLLSISVPRTCPAELTGFCLTSLTPIQGNDASRDPSLSLVGPNGFFAVAFESIATNLSNYPDTNGLTDILVYLPSTASNPKFLERISFKPPETGSGIPGESDGNSTNPSVTVRTEPNQVLITFASRATNLVLGQADTGNKRNIFLTTLTPPTASDGSDFNFSKLSSLRITKAAQFDTEPDGNSDNPKISGGGKFIVYESSATNLLSGTATSGTQIFLYNVETATTTLISKAADGTPADGDSSNPSISYAGRFIAYTTQAANLLSDSAAGATHLVYHDTLTGTNQRVNASAAGVPGDATGNTAIATISSDGQMVVFDDGSTNLVGNDTNGALDIFLKDLSSGAITRLNLSTSGIESNDDSITPVVGAAAFNSNDGNVIYSSAATNLVTGDVEARTDLFRTVVAALPKRTLTPATLFEVPADLSRQKRKVTVSMESFGGVSKESSAEKGVAGAKRGKLNVKYKVIAKREGASKHSLMTKIVKRTVISFKNLKPGAVYTFKYQGLITRGSSKKTRLKTEFSPEERIGIPAS